MKKYSFVWQISANTLAITFVKSIRSPGAVYQKTYESPLPSWSEPKTAKRSTACRWKNMSSLVLATLDRIARKEQTRTNLFLLSKTT